MWHMWRFEMIETSCLKIKYDKKMYMDFEKEILKRNVCPRLLKSRFYTFQNDNYVYFNTEGKIGLKDYIVSNIREGNISGNISVNFLYETQREVLCMCNELEYFLISPDRIHFNPNYLFWDIKIKKMFLAFIPLENKESKDFISEFWCFSEHLCNISKNPNWIYANKKFYEEFLNYRFSLKGMISYLNEMIKKEIS